MYPGVKDSSQRWDTWIPALAALGRDDNEKKQPG
jgi:hypothetical protein